MATDRLRLSKRWRRLRIFVAAAAVLLALVLWGFRLARNAAPEEAGATRAAPSPTPTRWRSRYTGEPPSRAEPVSRVEVPPSGTFDLPLSYVPEMWPAGVRFKPGYPYPLRRNAPPDVHVRPGEEDALYGEIPLAGSLRVSFAIARPADRSWPTYLFVDRNRDGDLTNDSPEGYTGQGEWASGATMELDLPRLDGTTHPFRIWLWTSLREGKPPGDSPGFNYYPWCHRKGELAFGATSVAVYTLDEALPPDGEWNAQRLWIDWNGDRREQACEWTKPGAVVRFRGATLKLAAIRSHGTGATFEASPAFVLPDEAVDVEALSARAPTLGFLAPPLEASDLEGRAIDLDAYRGKVLLVDFWATWCPPCMRELPRVKETHARFAGRGFEIVGVSLDKDPSALRDFAAKNGIGWRQACDGRGWESPVAERWGVTAIPATFLVGRDGRIVAVGLRGEALDAAVAKALEVP